ncbi:MAG: hypothetical protein P4M12_01625 [Gammaproteobacteria bacterium]|nr:hypothetical protein [Gammaproteobacteria bacterium]
MADIKSNTNQDASEDPKKSGVGSNVTKKVELAEQTEIPTEESNEDERLSEEEWDEWAEKWIEKGIKNGDAPGKQVEDDELSAHDTLDDYYIKLAIELASDDDEDFVNSHQRIEVLKQSLVLETTKDEVLSDEELDKWADEWVKNKIEARNENREQSTADLTSENEEPIFSGHMPEMPEDEMLVHTEDDKAALDEYYFDLAVQLASDDNEDFINSSQRIEKSSKKSHPAKSDNSVMKNYLKACNDYLTYLKPLTKKSKTASERSELLKNLIRSSVKDVNEFEDNYRAMKKQFSPIPQKERMELKQESQFFKAMNDTKALNQIHKIGYFSNQVATHKSHRVGHEKARHIGEKSADEKKIQAKESKRVKAAYQFIGERSNTSSASATATATKHIKHHHAPAHKKKR